MVFLLVLALVLVTLLHSQSLAVTPVPILREAALPVYPPIAKAAHVSGKVAVRLVVIDGVVVTTEFVSKAHAGGQGWLETAAATNARTWRFDRNVNTKLTVTYTSEFVGPDTDDLKNPTVMMLPSLNVIISAQSVTPTVTY